MVFVLVSSILDRWNLMSNTSYSETSLTKWSTLRLSNASVESIVAMTPYYDVDYGAVYKFMCINGHYFIKRTN